MCARTQRPYELKEYDPVWKETFSRTAEKIRPIIGDNLLEIEHIGSTSIEGMVAKPQVDILVVVKDLDRNKDCYELFTERGREYVGNGDEYVTEDAPDGHRLVSIHIFQVGHPQIEEYRVFRDYLKTHAEDRDLYISTKRELYSKFVNDFGSYDSGKEEVIAEIKKRAKEWSNTQI
jgi:GrpB-like predicted nucleotidyltransferase (UPF0157 family)